MKWTILFITAVAIFCCQASLADAPPENTKKGGSRTKTATDGNKADRSSKDKSDKDREPNAAKAKAKAEKAKRDKDDLDDPRKALKRSRARDRNKDRADKNSPTSRRKSSSRKSDGIDPPPTNQPLAEPPLEIPKSIVLFETSMGDITFELEDGEAPITVSNFLAYVDEGFYDGLIFHRVIPDFVVQGGGYTPDMHRREPTGKLPVPLETAEKLKNVAGTIAMARAKEPNSALTEFFINVVNNPHLDYPGWDGYGYAVFGHVIDGMDVLQTIRNCPCTRHPQYSGPTNDPEKCNPNPPILINGIRRLQTDLDKNHENDEPVVAPQPARSDPRRTTPRKQSGSRKDTTKPRKKTRKL